MTRADARLAQQLVGPLLDGLGSVLDDRGLDGVGAAWRPPRFRIGVGTCRAAPSEGNMESRWSGFPRVFFTGKAHPRARSRLVSVTRSPLQIPSPRVHVPLPFIPSCPGLSKVEQSTHTPLQRTVVAPRRDRLQAEAR